MMSMADLGESDRRVKSMAMFAGVYESKQRN